MKDIDLILKHYLVCVLFTEDIPLTVEDFDKEGTEKAKADINLFMEKVGESAEGLSEEVIGHNFWYDRQGHGTGFWDRDIPQGNFLTEKAKEFGEILVVEENGKIYMD